MNKDLLNKINKLDRDIDKLLNKKTNKSKKTKKQDKSTDEKKQYVCIFDKCPSGGVDYNWIFNDAIRLKKGNLCFFKKCKKGGKPIGSYAAVGKTLCSYDSCPKGTKAISKDDIYITNTGKNICIYPKNKKCDNNGKPKDNIFKGLFKFDGNYCNYNKNCPEGSIKLGKSLCQFLKGCPNNAEPLSLKHILE